MNHGELIEKCIGAFKRWQILVFLTVFLINMVLAWVEMSIVFLAPDQDFKCSTNASKCSSDCPKHIFDDHIFSNTIISQWDLTCDKDWFRGLSQSILMSGVLVGNLIFGYLSDRYGRRVPLVIAGILQTIAGVCVSIAPALWFFLLFRFLNAVLIGGAALVAFVIVIEVVGEKYRTTLGIVFQISNYIGQVTLGGLAYLLRDWKHLQLAISIPTVLFWTYYWILPESPRWLLTVNRTEEAITNLETAAKFNKLPLEDIRQDVMKSKPEVEPEQENILGLLRDKKNLIMTILVSFNWLVIGFSFFGVAQYIGQLAGDIFVNIVFAGLIQIPGNGIIIFTMDRFGRKISLIGTYLVCSVSLLGILALPTDPTWPTTILGSLGMMGSSLSFAVIYVYSGELFPTVVRNAGMGTSVMFARIGSMVSPFIIDLKKYYFWIPLVSYAVGPILATFACLKLPETKGKRLLDNVKDVQLLESKPVSA